MTSKSRRTLAIIISICVAFSMVIPVYAKGSPNASEENRNAQMGNSIKRLKTSEEKADKEELSTEDSEILYPVGGNSGEALKTFYKGYQKGYLVGIDVSCWQGNIDWDKVAGNVDFAIIRCGYGKNTKSRDDSKFARNVKACEELGIPYGVYLYSYANSVAKAKDEADHCLRLLRGHEPDLPVYYDLEDRSVASAGSSKIKSMAKAFCKKLTDNGYRAGVYASLSWWQGKLGSSVNGYSKWVAQWDKRCSSSSCQIWQFSSAGKVPGISGRVDMNEMMVKQSVMDSFMDGAYTEFSGKADNVSDYKAVVTSNAYRRLGPGCGYRTSGAVRNGEVINVGETYNGYAHIVESGATDIKTLEGGIVEEADVNYDSNITSIDESEGNGNSDASEHTIGNTEQGKWVPLSSIKAANSIKGWVRTSEGNKLLRYNGSFVTGVVKYKNYYYAFNSNGVQYKGTNTVIGTKKYLVSKQGIVILKKVKIKKKTVCRTGPGKKYKRKGKFKKAKSVRVIRIKGNWYRAETGEWFMKRDSRVIANYPQKIK